MKIFLTGGTGFIGSILRKELIREGHKITVLARATGKRGDLHDGISFIKGNPNEPGPWQEKVSEHDVIVNLAGASIFRRWSSKAKKEIFDSRILTTKHVVEALADRKGKETHLFSASGVGYYGFHGDEVLDENSPPGKDFLAQLTSEWESEARNAEKLGVRVVLCRFGTVLGRKGGALGKMVTVFRLRLGSLWGRGEQWFSWIHERDVVNIFLFLLKDKKLEGPVNFTASNPVRNIELTKFLGEVLQKTSFIPAVPDFVFTSILGEFANVFLKGQRVFPRKLLENGFGFQFPTLKEALLDLIES
ncbi:MAG: TIGR01777 family oxidoreductase [Nitrospirota bacterium]